MPTYEGPLPQYARNANRSRLVKLLCKGACSRVVWAEMNTEHPGYEVLRHSQVGDFTATCLKCGKVAKDPYNWIRP